MIIHIEERFRIVSDDFSWVVQRREGKNKKQWKSKSWFRTLPEAVRCTAELSHRSIPGTRTLRQAADDLSRLVSRYTAMVEGAPELVRDVSDAA